MYYDLTPFYLLHNKFIIIVTYNVHEFIFNFTKKKLKLMCVN